VSTVGQCIAKEEKNTSQSILIFLYFFFRSVFFFFGSLFFPFQVADPAAVARSRFKGGGRWSCWCLKSGVATVGGEENRGRWRSCRWSVGAEERKTDRDREGKIRWALVLGVWLVRFFFVLASCGSGRWRWREQLRGWETEGCEREERACSGRGGGWRWRRWIIDLEKRRSNRATERGKSRGRLKKEKRKRRWERRPVWFL